MHFSAYTVIVNETQYRSGFTLSAQIIYHTVLWAAKKHTHSYETAASQKTQHVCPVKQNITIKRDMSGGLFVAQRDKLKLMVINWVFESMWLINTADGFICLIIQWTRSTIRAQNK